MTQQIGITINAQQLQVPLPALLSMLAGAPQADIVPSPRGLVLPAEFGAELQGGIYAGPHWEDGKLVHLIAAPETLDDMEWDDAKEAASEYRGGGLSDWFLPDRDQLQIARIYAQAAFEKAWHWSGTPRGDSFAWAVDFELGDVYFLSRGVVFRVRPFRRFSA